MVEVEGRVGGFHPLWLVLLLLGPLGIVIIIVVATTGSTGARFGGLLPVSDAVLARYNRRLRTARTAFVIALGGVGTAMVALVVESVYAVALAALAAVAITVGVLTALAAAAAAARRPGPASASRAPRRWVTVEHAHPRFAAAVDERRRRGRYDRSSPRFGAHE